MGHESICVHFGNHVWVTIILWLSSILVIVSQDQLVDKVYFIKEGKCTATVKVPGTVKNFEVYLVSAVGQLLNSFAQTAIIILWNQHKLFPCIPMHVREASKACMHASCFHVDYYW